MTKVYVTSSALMATLFLVSASVQFNDPDWYFWIPLYTSAAYVNLVNCWSNFPLTGVNGIAKSALWLGEFLLSRVILEDYLGNSNTTGIWSLDQRHRVVREKLGSVLVILSMILQLPAASSFFQDPSKRNSMEVAPSIKYGMALLVVISLGLSVAFLLYPEDEIKF